MRAVKDIILIVKDVSQIAADVLKIQVDQVADAYRRVLLKVMTWALVVLAALLLAGGGLGMIVWGLYLQMSRVAGEVISALVLGVFLLFGATVLFFVAREMVRD